MRMVVMMRVAAGFVVHVAFVTVIVCMVMTVLISVAVLMIMRMPMMLAEHLLRQRVIFGKGLVVPVLVAAAIRARFGLKRHGNLIDRRADALEHIGQHRIVFEL